MKYFCPNCGKIGETVPCICGNRIGLLVVGEVRVHASEDLTWLTYQPYNEKGEKLPFSSLAQSDDTMERRVALMKTINFMTANGYTAGLPTELDEERMNNE